MTGLDPAILGVTGLDPTMLGVTGLDQAKYCRHSFHIGVATTTAKRLGDGGLHDQDAGKVPESGLPGIHQAP